MRSEKLLGIGLMAFGGVGIYLTLQITFRSFDNDPGPQLFPMMGFAILIMSGLGMMLTSRGMGAATEELEAEGNFRRGATVFAMMIAYAIGLWFLGYIIATLIALYAFYHLIAGPEKRVVWRGVLYSVLVTGGIYVTFVEFLNAFLPEGVLF